MGQQARTRRARTARSAISAALVGAFLAGWLLYRGEAVRDGFVSPWLVGAVLLIVAGAGLWFEQRWALRLGVLVVATLLVSVVIGAVVGDWQWWRAAAVAVAVWWLWDRWPSHQELRGDEPPETFPSLVLLCREPIYLEPTMLAAMASRAWDAHVEVVSEADTVEDDEEDEVPDSFVMGESPHFLCCHWPALLTINNFDEPYFDDVEEVAASVRELRARHAIQEHGAWISVDLVRWIGEVEGSEGRAYRLIGRLLAELADDNCLAVVDPASARVFAYDPETEAKLRSDDPRAALAQWYYAPVLAVECDDPKLAEAVAEARRRWPEFVAAFEQRDGVPASPFLVKAPFTDGRYTEFMWVAVTGIENGVIYGTLDNAPANVHTVQRGDIVRVRVEDLNDWLCEIDGAPIGAFTLKAIHDEDEYV